MYGPQPQQPPIALMFALFGCCIFLIVAGYIYQLTITCDEDEHVEDGECVACPSGETRDAGDSPMDGDTSCEPSLTTPQLPVGGGLLGLGTECQVNQYAVAGTCLNCPTGHKNESRDPITSLTSSCDICDVGYHVSGNLCVQCPPLANTTTEGGTASTPPHVLTAGGSDTTCELCKDGYRWTLTPSGDGATTGSCTICPNGSSSTGLLASGVEESNCTCDDNKYWDSSTNTCMDCGAGLTSSGLIASGDTSSCSATPATPATPGTTPGDTTVKQNYCTGNTHSAGADGAPVLGGSDVQADYTCVAGQLIAAASTTSCGDVGTACTDEICCESVTTPGGCVGDWSACTSSCEAAGTRSWINSDGSQCTNPGTSPACLPGDGACLGQFVPPDADRMCPSGKYAYGDGQTCMSCAESGDRSRTLSDETPVSSAPNTGNYETACYRMCDKNQWLNPADWTCASCLVVGEVSHTDQFDPRSDEAIARANANTTRETQCNMCDKNYYISSGMCLPCLGDECVPTDAAVDAAAGDAEVTQLRADCAGRLGSVWVGPLSAEEEETRSSSCTASDSSCSYQPEKKNKAPGATDASMNPTPFLKTLASDMTQDKCKRYCLNDQYVSCKKGDDDQWTCKCSDCPDGRNFKGSHNAKALEDYEGPPHSAGGPPENMYVVGGSTNILDNIGGAWGAPGQHGSRCDISCAGEDGELNGGAASTGLADIPNIIKWDDAENSCEGYCLSTTPYREILAITDEFEAQKRISVHDEEKYRSFIDRLNTIETDCGDQLAAVARAQLNATKGLIKGYLEQKPCPMNYRFDNSQGEGYLKCVECPDGQIGVPQFAWDEKASAELVAEQQAEPSDGWLSHRVARVPVGSDPAPQNTVCKRDICSASQRLIFRGPSPQAITDISSSNNQVTLSGPDQSAIVANTILHLKDAEGKTCDATPKDTDLQVSQINGSVITIDSGSSITGGTDVSNCVITRAPQQAITNISAAAGAATHVITLAVGGDPTIVPGTILHLNDAPGETCGWGHEGDLVVSVAGADGRITLVGAPLNGAGGPANHCVITHPGKCVDCPSQASRGICLGDFDDDGAPCENHNNGGECKNHSGNCVWEPNGTQDNMIGKPIKSNLGESGLPFYANHYVSPDTATMSDNTYCHIRGSLERFNQGQLCSEAATEGAQCGGEYVVSSTASCLTVPCLTRSDNFIPGHWDHDICCVPKQTCGGASLIEEGTFTGSDGNSGIILVGAEGSTINPLGKKIKLMTGNADAGEGIVTGYVAATRKITAISGDSAPASLAAPWDTIQGAKTYKLYVDNCPDTHKTKDGVEATMCDGDRCDLNPGGADIDKCCEEVGYIISPNDTCNWNDSAGSPVEGLEYVQGDPAMEMQARRVDSLNKCKAAVNATAQGVAGGGSATTAAATGTHGGRDYTFRWNEVSGGPSLSDSAEDPTSPPGCWWWDGEYDVTEANKNKVWYNTPVDGTFRITHTTQSVNHKRAICKGSTTNINSALGALPDMPQTVAEVQAAEDAATQEAADRRAAARAAVPSGNCRTLTSTQCGHVGRPDCEWGSYRSGATRVTGCHSASR